FQTTQLTRALGRWFEISELRVAAKPGKLIKVQRLWANYLKALISKPQTDYLFYSNDGFADFARWNATRLLYWYDAPRDWVSNPPERSDWAQWLRYQNLTDADFVFAVSHKQVEMAKALRKGRES